MSVFNWAEHEVELAKKNETNEFGYADCLDTALEAYKVLVNGEDNGSNVFVASNILQRLVKGINLTPIEDIDNEWERCSYVEGIFQSRRCSSLFKNVDDSGNVTYSDVSRCVFQDACGGRWHSGTADKVCNELFPITFPYVPNIKPYVVNGIAYNHADKENPYSGSFDSVYVKNIITPDDEVLYIDRTYREDYDHNMNLVEPDELDIKLRNI